ncbi:MAG: hypothetical protein O2838_07335 [Proteobacteria bacterium]|nr:hypothetical protein [Pseudomonadota bacterium]
MRKANLDDFFAQARSQPPEVSFDLQSRILSDAFLMQDQWARKAAPINSSNLWLDVAKHFFAELGGAMSISSVLAAALSGMWVGFAPPAALADVFPAFLTTQQSDTFDLLPSDNEFQ